MQKCRESNAGQRQDPSIGTLLARLRLLVAVLSWLLHLFVGHAGVALGGWLSPAGIDRDLAAERGGAAAVDVLETLTLCFAGLLIMAVLYAIGMIAW